jgi:hypothetical protein
MKTALLYLCFMGFVVTSGIIITKHVIPKLNPDNRFRKWWERNIIDDDPDHL